MSASKHFDKIAIVFSALVLIITALYMIFSSFITNSNAIVMGYENKLFDNTKVHTIDIVMDNWDTFLENAESEEYYQTSMIIDNESFKNIAIRAKGNTSLSSVTRLESTRYSFKVEFDHYDSSFNYHGLDKLSLNNLIQDTTMMKDYLSYTLFNSFDVNSPLCSFVFITVNGEDFGLYLAVEGIEDSFLTRNYGYNIGNLYKPDSMSFGIGRENGKDFDMNNFNNQKDNPFPNANANPIPNPNVDNNTDNLTLQIINEMPQNNMPANAPNFGDRATFGGMGSTDVKLQYTGDNFSSYTNIWDSAKTDITESDKKRLINSLKQLSNNENLDSVVDIDKVIRYFVVHNFLCNGDSYTGSIVHNYYLYEKDGTLSMIPWDYNLAFGTFESSNAQSTINTPIDSPVSNRSENDRPMWDFIMSFSKYTDLYHSYFAKFLESTDFEKLIDDTYNLIKNYVKKDPTSFYSYDEFEKGVETIRSFCALRKESIIAQLTSGDTKESQNFVDASNLNLSLMGSMGDTNGGFNRRENNQNPFTADDITGASTLSNAKANDNIDSITSASENGQIENNNFPPQNRPQGPPSQIPNLQDGQMPEINQIKPSEETTFSSEDLINTEEFNDNNQSQSEQNETQEQINDLEESAQENSTNQENAENFGNRPSFNNQIPGANFNAGANNLDSLTIAEIWIWIAVSILILIGGLVAVVLLYGK